jgi:hypothetical protein
VWMKRVGGNATPFLFTRFFLKKPKEKKQKWCPIPVFTTTTPRLAIFL